MQREWKEIEKVMVDTQGRMEREHSGRDKAGHQEGQRGEEGGGK